MAWETFSGSFNSASVAFRSLGVAQDDKGWREHLYGPAEARALIRTWIASNQLRIFQEKEKDQRLKPVPF